MPVVAVVLGALVADERITATTILGGGIVCAGVYLGTVARRPVVTETVGSSG